jgi:hypothetical protein
MKKCFLVFLYNTLDIIKGGFSPVAQDHPNTIQQCKDLLKVPLLINYHVHIIAVHQSPSRRWGDHVGVGGFGVSGDW